MSDRRRSARFVALIVAAMAVAGTTPPMPTPGPTQAVTTQGTTKMSGDSGVAIVPFEVDFTSAAVRQVVFTPTAGRSGGQEPLTTWITSVDGESMFQPPQSGTSARPDESAWSVQCPALAACGRRFALIIRRNGEGDGDQDVPWVIPAAVTFEQPPTSATIVRIVETSMPDLRPAAATTSVLPGGSVRLSETDRVRLWTAHLRLGAGEAVGGRWPRTVRAVLMMTADETVGAAPPAPGAEDHRMDGRFLPAVNLSLLRSDVGERQYVTTQRPFVFDPFSTCGSGPCSTDLTLRLDWAEFRPEVEYDASWSLVIDEVAADGNVVPIEATVEPVPGRRQASATTSGTLDVGADAGGARTKVVVGASGVGTSDKAWSRQDAPARGLLHVRVTPAPGSAPLPEGTTVRVGVGVNSGDQYPGDIVPVGGESTMAFTPLGCQIPTDHCQSDLQISASIAKPTPNSRPPGIAVRVEWSIEVAVATTAGGEVTLAEPPPSPSP